ncbi:MAG: hypothetical protein JXN65_10160 [Clostridia bacterium]|nr:hypothetical protein [Clostridia bacterium]
MAKVKYRNTPLWVYILLAMAPIIFAAGIYVYSTIVSADYRAFAEAYAQSCEYAEKHDSLTAEYNGVTTKIAAENYAKIRRSVFSAYYSEYLDTVPEGAPLTLNYGDDSTLNVWKNGPESIIIQYIYPDETSIIFRSSDNGVHRFVDFERLISEDWDNEVIG